MKHRANKLDKFTADLDLWLGEENRPYAWIVERLAARGLNTSPSSLSNWWSARQVTLAREKLFSSIANGTKLARDMEEEFRKNPAPTFETLCKLLRTIALNLSAKGQLDPTMMKLAKGLLAEAVKISGGMFDKEKFEREFDLAKAKFAADEDARKNTAAAWVLYTANTALAEKIAASSMSNAEKIAALRKAMFADVDAMQQSGEVVIPQ